MKKSSHLIALLSLLSWLSLPLSADTSAAVKEYHTVGQEVMKSILTQDIDVAKITKQVDVLVASGIVIAKEYMAKHPETTPVLEVLVSKIEKLKGESFETLEADWHDVGYFKKPGNEVDFDFDDEDLEHVLDPLHVVIHPLLVLRAAEAYEKSKSVDELQVMKEEMGEGLEQLHTLQKTLGL